MQQNRICLIAVTVLTLFFLVTLNVHSTEKWIIFTTSENGDENYYDAASQKQIEKKVIQVWRMKKLSTVSKAEYARMNKKYHNLDHINTLVEMDCKRKTIKPLSKEYYDDKGNILERYDNPDSGRRLTRPVSISDSLLNTICSK